MKTLKKWPVIMMILLGSAFGFSSCEEQFAQPEGSKDSNTSYEDESYDNDDDDPEPPCTGCKVGN